MKNLDETNYDVDLSDGVITFKNINTTLGFVRYNETAEVEYIFVNPMFNGLSSQDDKLLRALAQEAREARAQHLLELVRLLDADPWYMCARE